MPEFFFFFFFQAPPATPPTAQGRHAIDAASADSVTTYAATTSAPSPTGTVATSHARRQIADVRQSAVDIVSERLIILYEDRSLSRTAAHEISAIARLLRLLPVTPSRPAAHYSPQQRVPVLPRTRAAAAPRHRPLHVGRDSAARRTVVEGR
jgi:hypothetical protein